MGEENEMKTNAFSRLVAGMLLALPALAQDGEATVNSGDNAWVLVCSALVLMMTGPGLALFYGGLVRKKNLLATMMQSFIMMAVMTVLWALVGYSLAFAEGHGSTGAFIGGFDFVFLNGVG
jgi:Amt family ammonium transporter